MSEVDTGKDDYQPTVRAIQEHLNNLKKSIGGKTKTKTTNSNTPRATATPKSTPRKPAAIKTPKSSAKRKRTSKSSDEEEDATMVDGEDNSDAEREMLKYTPSAPCSSLSRRSKSVAKTYHEDNESNDESDDEFATPGVDARAATPTPAAGEDMQTDFFAGGAFDGVHESAQNQPGDEMEGVATGAFGHVATGTLTPQGRAGRGSKLAGSGSKRTIIDDDSDGSEFSPDM